MGTKYGPVTPPIPPSPPSPPSPPAPPTPPAPPPSPPSPSPPASTHYEKPPCQHSDEIQGGVQGVTGSACLPKCKKNKCPADVPAGVTAEPDCALSDTSGNKYCVLKCTKNAECDTAGGATCAIVQAPLGVCLYPGSTLQSMFFLDATGIVMRSRVLFNYSWKLDRYTS